MDRKVSFSPSHCFVQTLVLLLMMFSLDGWAQDEPFLRASTRSLHAYTDVYKTDFENPFRKLQAGIEVGYQLNEKLTFTGGLEFWNREPTPLIALGNRFHPFGPAFIRYRALIGRTADAALGLGYTLPLRKHWQLEAATDYYLNAQELGFRIGFGYSWRKEE